MNNLQSNAILNKSESIAYTHSLVNTTRGIGNSNAARVQQVIVPNPIVIKQELIQSGMNPVNKIETRRCTTSPTLYFDNLNATDEEGRTLLHLSTIHDCQNCLKYYLKHMPLEACITKDKRGYTPLDYTVIKNKPHSLELYINHLNQTNTFSHDIYTTSVYNATLLNCFSCLNIIIKHIGQKVLSITDKDKDTPLDYAITQKNWLCALLIMHTLNINESNDTISQKALISSTIQELQKKDKMKNSQTPIEYVWQKSYLKHIKKITQ